MAKSCWRLWSTLLAAVLLAVCAAPGAPAAAAAQPAKSQKLKVAFVYIGPIGDGGWTYQHELGRRYLEQVMGDQVETTYIESVPEGADAERVFEELAQKGYKLIFGTSFGYGDAMLRVARRHPDVVFMHCSGLKTAPNLGTYLGREHEAFYLEGVIGGYLVKDGFIGMVAAHPIPEVIRAINAFALGARSINPKARVRVVWTNTWYDPAKEKMAALSLLDAGADVLAMYQDSPATLQAAQERGKLAFGNDSDARHYAPKAFLTASVWNWGPYYVRVAKAVIEGTWKPEAYWGPMKDGIVDLAPLSDLVPPQAKAKVEEVKKAIFAGRLDPFQGPIRDQSGRLRVPAGRKMTDEELLAFDWFVEGVEGTIPR